MGALRDMRHSTAQHGGLSLFLCLPNSRRCKDRAARTRRMASSAAACAAAAFSSAATFAFFALLRTVHGSV